MSRAGRAAFILLAPLALSACGPPPPPDDAYLRAHPELRLGGAVLEVRGAERRLDQVYYWVPNSFADRAGLGALLRAGRNDAPADEVRSISFRRHRSYPVHGWSSGAERVEIALVAGPGERPGTWEGRLAVRGTGVACDADVRGTGIGSAAYEGTCEDGGAVRLALRPWQAETPFLVSAANRAPLGAALPDFAALRRRCAASRAAPWCGPQALPRLTDDAGEQRREPGSGRWIPAKDGRVLLMLPWRDAEELLVLPALPAPGPGQVLEAESLRYAPDLAEGQLASRAALRIDADFDGTVFVLRPPGGAPRRVVPDTLVVSGIFGDVL